MEQVRKWFIERFLSGNRSKLRLKGNKYNLVHCERNSGSSIANQSIPDGVYFCMVELEIGLRHTFVLTVVGGLKSFMETIASQAACLTANSYPLRRGKWKCILKIEI